MERKANEALAALQKPPAEQVLTASNVSPAAPSFASEDVFEIKTDPTNASSEKELLANEPNEAFYLEHPEAAPIHPEINAKEIVNPSRQGRMIWKLLDDGTTRTQDLIQRPSKPNIQQSY